ncbi:MAG: polyprenyl diphosphate synthase [Planctomycetota bacterium]
MSTSNESKLQETAQRLDIEPRQIPCHIARAHGHREGAKTVEKIAQFCVDFGIECLTLYSFSMENWKRPKNEVDALMYLYTEYLTNIRPTLMKNNVKLVHLGQFDRLPPDVQNAITKTMEITEKNTGMVLALALNYGSRIEIIDAVKEISRKHKNGELKLNEIDEDCISNHLYTAGLTEPDLLIRTANEMRISNFLLWQISYSEFYVTKTLWPDFKRKDLEKAILAYAKRDRRFGTGK